MADALSRKRLCINAFMLVRSQFEHYIKSELPIDDYFQPIYEGLQNQSPNVDLKDRLE